MNRQLQLRALPRLSREGFVPAGPTRRVRSGMLIPKPASDDDTGIKLQCLPITATERRALQEIVETADLVTDEPFTYLVARVSNPTLDVLATFEVERADREMDHDEGDSAYLGDCDLEIEFEAGPPCEDGAGG